MIPKTQFYPSTEDARVLNPSSSRTPSDILITAIINGVKTIQLNIGTLAAGEERTVSIAFDGLDPLTDLIRKGGISIQLSAQMAGAELDSTSEHLLKSLPLHLVLARYFDELANNRGNPGRTDRDTRTGELMRRIVFSKPLSWRPAGPRGALGSGFQDLRT